jgi:flavin-dependent dehydrogenase
MYRRGSVGRGVSAMASVSEATRVRVVGGGFAGVSSAKQLAGEAGVRVTSPDRDGFHQFHHWSAELLGPSTVDRLRTNWKRVS